jgi:hypothetical protein
MGFLNLRWWSLSSISVITADIKLFQFDKYSIACQTQIYKWNYDTKYLGHNSTNLHVWNNMMVPDRYVACGTLMSDQWQELTFHYPCSIVGITAYLKKNRSRFLKVCGLQTTVKNQIMAWRKPELHCSYVSGSTITPSPGYDWGMEGIELHCSYASKIKQQSCIRSTQMKKERKILIRTE